MNYDYEAERKKNKRSKLLKAALIWIIEIIIVTALAFFIVHLTIKKTITIGSTMEPTLKNGESVYLFTKAYLFSSPNREDVIAFYDDKNKTEESGESTIIFRRVIGLPGENIKIRGGQIIINDKPVNLKYTYAEMNYSGVCEEGVTLAEDEFFVLCDNRSDTFDSRTEEFGMVKEDRILGRVIVRDKGLSLVNKPLVEEKKESENNERK